MNFVFTIKTEYKSVAHDNSKIAPKKISKIIFVAWWNAAKMSILKRLIMRLQQEKMMDFDYCDEYLGSISNKILFWQCFEKQHLIQLAFTNW